MERPSITSRPSHRISGSPSGKRLDAFGFAVWSYRPTSLRLAAHLDAIADKLRKRVVNFFRVLKGTPALRGDF